MRRVLILGGTTEASAIAAALAGDARVAPMLSYAGATKSPRPPPIPFRVGGFGGVDGLAAFLREHRIERLIDATHPFAATMKRHAAQAAARAGVPLLGVLRPAWAPVAGDRWTVVADMAAAARALGATPRRVLLTVGQKDLAPFAAAPWHSYVVRSIDMANLPGATVIAARGPFDEAGECALLARHRIEALVTKNSGGEATSAKLAAARQLGIAVVMLARPPPPDMEVVPDAHAALRWIERGV